MTDRKQEQKADNKVKVEKLELAKETVQPLTDEEAEAAKGGAYQPMTCRATNVTCCVVR